LIGSGRFSDGILTYLDLGRGQSIIKAVFDWEFFVFKLAWERSRIHGKILADAQARALNLLFYFTFMIPFGIGVRLLSDPLQQKTPPQWPQREPVVNTIEEARRQG
jgi:hypothetical protein